MFKRWIVVSCIAFLSWGSATAQVETDIKNGETVVPSMTMGEGDHAVIAIHGWTQHRDYFFTGKAGELGQALAKAGFSVIAIEWEGRPPGGFSQVAAAIKFAQKSGAKKISLMGHSRGAELAANYAKQQPDGTFDTVIQFSSVDDQGLPMRNTKKLFAFNKYDNWAKWQPAAFDKSAEPRKMIDLGGSGHHVSALTNEKADLVQDVIGLLKQ
jgi:alpha-beta hydrolase superfamily lysophospholipase